MRSYTWDCWQVGRLLVDRGCRVLTGGEGGVMEWASRGARASPRWQPGDCVALMRHCGGQAAMSPPSAPGSTAANRFVDVPISTGKHRKASYHRVATEPRMRGVEKTAG